MSSTLFIFFCLLNNVIAFSRLNFHSDYLINGLATLLTVRNIMVQADN
jgi:hypothetical protein